jgi:hypothetical protein
VVEWRFENILLPDSTTDEPNSHGAVGFRIRPVEPLLPGTVLANTAQIYFDFNAPIVTNTSTLVATATTALNNATAPLAWTVGPVPTTGPFAVRRTDGQALGDVEVLDPLGRHVMQYRTTESVLHMDGGAWPPGTYLVRIGSQLRSVVVLR